MLVNTGGFVPRSLTVAGCARTTAESILAAEGGHIQGPLEIVWQQLLRHRTTLLKGHDGAAWLLKQRGPPLRNESLSLDGEVAFYRALEKGLLGEIPASRLVGASHDGSAILLEGYATHFSAMASIHVGFVDTEILPRLLGEKLGTLHALDGAPDIVAGRRLRCPIRDLTACTPEQLAERPPIFRDFLRLLQSDVRLGRLLREMSRAWEPSCVVHGDIRLENLLVPIDRMAQVGPVIVDWELWGLGDWRWDCASMVGSYLLSSLEAGLANRTDIDLLKLSGEVRRAIGVFWDSYEASRKGDPRFDPERGGQDVFSWAGYWILHRLFLLVPVRRRLAVVDIAAINLAAKLLLPDEEGSLVPAAREVRDA